MDLAGDQLLPRPALAQDQDRRVGRGDEVDLPRDRPEGRALANELAEDPDRIHLFAQVFVLQFQTFPQRLDLLERSGGGDGRGSEVARM